MELKATSNSSKKIALAREGGNSPVSSLKDRDTERMLGMSKIEGGIVPDKKLLLRSKEPRDARYPNEEGIVPVNWFSLSSIRNKDESNPISSGIVPTRPESTAQEESRERQARSCCGNYRHLHRSR